MFLPDNKSIEYENNQLAEVICQLRFPTILSIDTREPAEFQEAVRQDFPKYMLQVEKLPPINGSQQRQVNNYSFISEDGGYKLSLTKNFLALSTVRYTNWDDFARWLDQPLGMFISIYKPAYFERVGLRYVNAFSREKLGLTDCRWDELIAPRYLSVLNGIPSEADVTKASVDVEMKLSGEIRAKIHAGPGFIKRNIRMGNQIRSVQDKERRFIFDEDIFVAGNISLQSSAETLGSVHIEADRLFSESITDKLHNAMNPVYN